MIGFSTQLTSQCLGTFYCGNNLSPVMQPTTNLGGDFDYTCINSCLDSSSLENPKNLCDSIEIPVKWFKIKTDVNAAQIFINVTTKGQWTPLFAIFEGPCGPDLPPINTENLPGCNIDWSNKSQINQPISGNTEYWIVVGIDKANNVDAFEFDLCVSTTITQIICIGDGACQQSNLSVVFRSGDPDGALGLSLEGPFKPDETITVCGDIFYDATETGVDWFIGMLPFYDGIRVPTSYFASAQITGNGQLGKWFDDGIPKIQEKVNHLCIKQLPFGKMQLCNALCMPCDCELGLEIDTPMPGGWFWLSTGGNAGCENDGTPQESWGIGSSMANVSFCLDLIVDYPDVSESLESKIMFGVQTFSDGVMGCWEDPVGECLIDEPFVNYWDVDCGTEDLDGDGYHNYCDCDDNDPLVNAISEEIFNNEIDENCDGIIEYDLDGDGYSSLIDCDDTNIMINPGMVEIPYNGEDDDCDASTPDDDLDGDGFDLENDCDDMNPIVNEDQIEICDGIDNNCDGEIDEGFAGFVFYLDEDGDGIGSEIDTFTCFQPEGYVSLSGDCDDLNPDIFPSAMEVCDSLDNNCNGEVDEDLTFEVYYSDEDMDGYGDDDSAFEDCLQPPNVVSIGGDCNDENAMINPGMVEIPNNGVDEDCDGEDLMSNVSRWNHEEIFLLYPNPTNRFLTLEFKTSNSYNIEVYTLLGNRILIFSNVINNFEMDMEGLESGIYFLKCSNSEGELSIRKIEIIQ